MKNRLLLAVTRSLLSMMCACAIVGCQATHSRWAGTWGDQTPGHSGELKCRVVQVSEADWRADFTGHCGRYFSYKVEMQGHSQDDAVVFRGEADLGEKDGGRYKWTGELHGDKFTGEYISAAGKTGSFAMAKQQ